MAEGDSFLGFLKDTVNSVPVLGAYSSAAWGRGNFDPNPQPQDETFMSRVGAVANAIPFFKVAGDATNFAAENIAPLKFALDFGNRTADSVFTGLQAAGDADQSSSFLDGWKHGWGTFGQEGHLTAGNLIGAAVADMFNPEAFATNAAFNPLTAQGSAALLARSKQTWYGDVAGGVSDLAAGFITPLTPLAAPVKLSRAVNTIRTAGEAERVSATFNAGYEAGKIPVLKGRAGKLQALTRDALTKTGDSVGSGLDYYDTAIPQAHPRVRQLLAEATVEANRLGPDMAELTLGNAILANMGDEAARAALKTSAPLVATKIANAVTTPTLYSDVTSAVQKMVEGARSGKETRLGDVMEEVLGTPLKQAELTATLDKIEKLKVDAGWTADLRSRMQTLRKPQLRAKDANGNMVDTFDQARLKENRAKAQAHYDQTKADLSAARKELTGNQRFSDGANKATVTKGAMKDAGAAADSAAGRDAVAAFGPTRDAKDFNQATGAAKQRADDLAAQLEQARADRDLFNQTRISTGRSDALSMAEAELRIQRRGLASDAQKMEAMRPGLNASSRWLANIDEMGQSGQVLNDLPLKPTALQRAKAAYIKTTGESFLFSDGDFSTRTFFHVHPAQHLATIGTDYGVSAIQVADRFRGKRELGMYLKKSGLYSGDEIRNHSEAFARAERSQVPIVVTAIHDEMLGRLLNKVAPDLSPADVKKATTSIKAGLDHQRSYLTKKSTEAEQTGSKWAALRESPLDDDYSGANHMVSQPFLRSHVADTVPFADPVRLEKALLHYTKTRSLLGALGDVAGGTLDLYNMGWKLAALMRPGLFVRNMLDNGLRAQAIIGTGNYAIAGVNGTLHKLRNDAFRVGDYVASKNAAGATALEKIGLHHPDGVVEKLIGDSGIKVKIGNGKTTRANAYDQIEGSTSLTDLAAKRSAMTRGGSFQDALMGRTMSNLDNFTKDASKWTVVKAESVGWNQAFTDHANTLLASPTARKLIEMETKPGMLDLSAEAVTRELFSDPAVRAEYNIFRNEADMSKDMFVRQVLSETDSMFPEPGMAADIMAGKYKGARGEAWLNEHFPKQLRFDLPGQESIFELPNAGARVRKVMDSFFRNIMDEPDFWLVRHPVYVSAWAKQYKLEAASLIKARTAKFGPNAELTARDLKKINDRAVGHGVSVVKDYMYDSTKSTALSQGLHRIVPFFQPWFDAARSWSKLIYDDPSRMGNLSGLWNAPMNLNQYMSTPLVVDVNGEPVVRGSDPAQGGGEHYIVMFGNKKTIQGADGQTKDRVAGGFRLRMSSLNTLVQGEVPWLPGWGPSVIIPAQIALGNNRDFALQLSSSQNPVLKTLMQSLFMDGQVPDSSLGNLAKSQVPAWLRRTYDGLQGVDFAKNTQYALNQAYIESLKNGTPFDFDSEFKRAQGSAQAASWVQTVASFGFGFSGDAQVQGEFYVGQMHQLQGLAERPADGGPSVLEGLGYPSVEAAFAAQFPEAANLRWSFTRNETGINATVSAQQSANAQRGLIDKAPGLGWFIAGGDNVGGEWSQTAYNQQKQFGYGIANEGRKTLSVDEIAKRGKESLGWDEFTRLSTELANTAAQYNLDPAVVSAVKQSMVQYIGQKNPEWFAAHNDRTSKIEDFYQQADRISQDPSLANRQDIAMYAQYRGAMKEVMEAVGVKSLAGSGKTTVAAKSVLNTIGTQMARENIGFQQMWERMLYNDVKPPASEQGARTNDG